LMLETTRAKLAERGIEIGVVDLEVKGIPKILAAHGLAFEDLELEGCTIFYRRDVEDMPLAEIPEDATLERIAKARAGRRKILDKATRKFGFKLEPLCAPEGLITEGDRLVGLRFRRTKIENGRVVMQDETFERRGSCVISSIGSIPEPISGIAMKGELFDFSDWDIGRIEGYPTVFSVGNVVTGKGNIVASRKHAAHVSEDAIEKFLGLDEDRGGEEALHESVSARVRREAEVVANHLDRQPPASAETVAALLGRVRARQAEVGYQGDYAEWIAKVSPPDSE
jgi:ferredoxin--NADP+ reductase